MKVEIGEEINVENPRDLYLLTIVTMTGDADDEHEVKLILTENLLKYALLILQKIKEVHGYPDELSEEDILNFDWFIDNGWYNNELSFDKYQYHTITYYDINGKAHHCSATLESTDILTDDLFQRFIVNGE